MSTHPARPFSPLPAVLCLLAAALPAQTWTQVATSTNPGAVRDGAMAYHGAAGHTVLFGGWPALADTWTYDGTDWTLATPANVPPGRRDVAMAYDAQRARVVMFGGSQRDDTWEWDGTDWTQVTPATTPPARSGHSMAYDLVRGRVVMFGGTANPILPPVLRDTWEYDGSDWVQVPTANAPSEALDAAMCYDLARGVCVLYGGTSMFGAPDQKTWEYDGTDWTDVSASVGPGPTATLGLGVSNAALVYDVQRGRSILHGGRTPNGTFATDTWAYDGTSWTLLTSGTPTSRTGSMLAMDDTRDRVVLYGGSHGNLQTHYLETWEFAGAALASYTPFGAGCPGSGGVPTLAPLGGSLPRSGQTLVVELANLPPGGGVAFLAMGFDDTTWNGQPLPLDLGALGMPGCFGYVRVDFTVLLTHAAGSATQSTAIPPGLDGWTFYQQGLSLDPTAGNQLGATVSNAGEAVIGS